MKLRKLKSKIARTLIVTMLASTLAGGTSLAASTDGEAVDGVLGQDYKLVTLHTDIGEFKFPKVYKEDTKDPVHSGSDATPSDATSSNASKAASVEDGDELLDDVDLLNDLGTTGSLVPGTNENATETTFVVEGDYLDAAMVEEIIGKPGEVNENLFYGYWDGDVSAPKKAMVSWLAKEDDPDSVVNLHGNERLYLEEDVTHLYAHSYLKASNRSEQMKDLDVGAQDLPEDVRLRVTDLEEKKTPEELLKALEEGAVAGTVYDNLDTENILQLDIHTTQDNYAGTAKIKMELPKTFIQKAEEEGLDFVVIHFGKNGTEVITPDIYLWGGNEGAIAGIEFELHDFSPVIVALAKATHMVNVKLENVKDGFGSVFSNTWVGRDRQVTYLPIDEEVLVPAGTTFYLRSNAYRGNRAEGYQVTVDGETIELDNQTSGSIYRQEFTVEESMDKVIFTPSFTVRSDDENDYKWLDYSGQEEAWTAPRVMDTTLEYWHYDPATHQDEKLQVTNWKLIQVYVSSSENDWTEVTDRFTLDAVSGNLKSTETVEPGFYDIAVEFKYGNQIIEDYVVITTGVAVEFGVHLGQYDDKNKTQANSEYTESEWYAKNTTFGIIRQDTIGEFVPAMYGGYEFAGWYNGKEELKDSTEIKEAYSPANAWFKKDGKWYDPTIRVTGGSGDNNDPNNPDNPNRPSYSGGSGGGGGSSSSSSYAADTISGSWQRDDRGWRFQLSNGSYAVNQWGRLKGVWYYFGADTYMMTGWLNLNGVWYYLNPAQGAQEGQMKTGWIFDQSYGRWFYLSPAAGSQEGRMLTGWQQIGGVWYYLNPAADGTGGAMLADQWIGDYYVNADGAWVQNMTR